jgi:hypothetical protein
MNVGVPGSGVVQKSLATGCLAFLLVAGCNSSNPTERNPDNYRVRVINGRADTFTVVIGPADYGTIAPGDTTAYLNVYEGSNVVQVNGQIASGSPVHFGSGSQIPCRWTYTFQEGGSGFAWDGCD